MKHLASILSPIVVAGSALAQDEIQVDIETTGSPIFLEFDEGEAIDLTNVNNTWKIIKVYSDSLPNLYDIGPITLDGSTDSTLKVFLGSGTFPQDGGPSLTNAGRHFDGLVISGGFQDHVWFAGAHSGDLTDPVQAGRVINYRVGGDITAGVTASDDMASAIDTIIAGAFGRNGGVLASNGGIEHVVANGPTGDFESGVSAPNGNIGEVRSDNGQILCVDAQTIGTAGNLATISAGSKIFSLEADSINADISTPTGTGSHFIQHIQTVVGDLSGSVETKNLTFGDGDLDRGWDISGDLAADLLFGGGVFDPITVGGDLSGTVTITNDMNREIHVTGSLTGNIIIGGDLKDASPGGNPIDDIVIGSGGLDGFITVNAANGSGDWLGTVKVGSFVLGGCQDCPDEVPDYSRTIAQLGGGAVGIAADWGFHPTDTYPADGIVIGQPQFQDDSTVRIFHYGPIDDEVHNMDAELTVEKRPIEGGSWTDAGDFDFSFDAGNRREIRIDPAGQTSWVKGHDYRVVVDSGDLQIPSDVLIGSSNADISAYTYEFCYSN